MSSREFTEWQKFAEVEPFGEERADLRAAIIASTIANVHRGKGRALKAKDFMPKFEREEKSWQHQLQIVEALNTAFGGLDLRPQKVANGNPSNPVD